MCEAPNSMTQSDARPAMIEYITYYDTATHCYLFGSTSKSATSYYVATFTKSGCARASDRTERSDAQAGSSSERAADELHYSMSEDALDAEAARSLVEKIKHEEAVKSSGRAIAVLGCVRFTCEYYLLLITERRRIGSVAYRHALYEISDVIWLALYDTSHVTTVSHSPRSATTTTTSMSDGRINSAEGSGMSAMARLMSAAVPYLFKNRSSEDHYRAQFQENDLRHYFYYSPTYDLSNTMQVNLGTASPARRMKYIWNDFLLEPFAPGGLPTAAHDERAEYCGMADYDFAPHIARWLVYCIHGAATQRTLSVQPQDGTLSSHTDEPTCIQLTLTLIGRVSKEFTGARYLRRGVNGDGHVANHVETEQICCALMQSSKDAMSAGAATGSPDTMDVVCSSFVQVRGSVPLRWYHASSNLPRPAIRLGATDFCATATCKHFQELLADYGGPVIVLDLLKQCEHHTRESPLGHAYRRTLDMLVSYISVERNADSGSCVPAVADIVRYRAIDLRALAERAWNVVTAAAEEDVQCTGFLVWHATRGVVRRQCGVVRANCVDCVDRTNIAQFLYGLHALGAQLQAMQVLHDAVDLVRSSAVQDVLLEMFLALGDAIAVQYGGSAQVGAGVLHRGAGWDQMMGMKRLYNNVIGDGAKQSMLNLFLGKYQPVPRLSSRALNHRMHPPRPYMPTTSSHPYITTTTTASSIEDRVESGGGDVAVQESNVSVDSALSPSPAPHLQAEEIEEHQSHGTTDTSVDSTVLLDPMPPTVMNTPGTEQLVSLTPTRRAWRTSPTNTTTITSSSGARDLLANYITGRRRPLWGGPGPRHGLDEACADYYLHVRHAPSLPPVEVVRMWWAGPLAWHAMHNTVSNTQTEMSSGSIARSDMEAKASATLVSTTACTSSAHSDVMCDTVSTAWQRALHQNTSTNRQDESLVDMPDMTGRTSALLLRSMFGAAFATHYTNTELTASLEGTCMRDWVQPPRVFAHDVHRSLYAHDVQARQTWCSEDVRCLDSYTSEQIMAYVLPTYGSCQEWSSETFVTALQASEPVLMRTGTLRAVRQAHMNAASFLPCRDVEQLTEKVQAMLRLDDAAQLGMVIRFVQVLQQREEAEQRLSCNEDAKALDDADKARDVYRAHYAQVTCDALRDYFAASPSLQPHNVADTLHRWRACMCDATHGVPRRHVLRYTTQAVDSRRSSHIPDAVIVPGCFSAHTLFHWLRTHATQCGLCLTKQGSSEEESLYSSSRSSGVCEDTTSPTTRAVWGLMGWLVQAGWVIPVLRPQRQPRVENTPHHLFTDKTMLYQLTDTLDVHILNPALVQQDEQEGVSNTAVSDLVALSEVLARVALNCFSAVRSTAPEMNSPSAYRALVQPVLDQLASLAAGLRRCTLDAPITTNISTASFFTTAMAGDDAAMNDARLVLLVNLYNALYVHAWLYTSVQTTNMLSSDTITFYETHGYQLGQEYVTLSMLKNDLLRGNLPPSYACYLLPSAHNVSRSTSLLASPSSAYVISHQAKDALGAALVWSDAMATTRMTTSYMATEEGEQGLSTLAAVRARALERAHTAWCEDQRYVSQRVVLALLDTYIAPPCNVSPVSDYDPHSAQAALRNNTAGSIHSSPLRFVSRRKSESVLSASKSEREPSPQSATSSSSTNAAKAKSKSSKGDSTRKEPWSTLTTAASTSTSTVKDMQASGSGTSTSNANNSTAVPLYFRTSDTSGQSTSGGGRAVQHLCVALQPSSNNTLTAEEQLREVAASFAFSMTHSGPLALTRMLQPLLSYPEVFGELTQDAMRALQRGQDAAHALRATQNCITQLL